MHVYHLVCNQDPRALGIERPDGAWDLAEFEVHRLHCRPCREFQAGLATDVGRALDPAADTGRPAAAEPPRLNTAATMVVLEVIDLLSQSRHAFRSKQVERARKLLSTLLS